MEVNNARDEAEEATEQYWQLHDAMLEKQQELDAMQAELEAARSQAAGLQVGHTSSTFILASSSGQHQAVAGCEAPNRKGMFLGI